MSVVIFTGLGPSVSPLYETIPPAGTVRMSMVAGSGFGRRISGTLGRGVAQLVRRIDSAVVIMCVVLMSVLLDIVVALFSGVFVFLGSAVDLPWLILVAVWMIGVLIFTGVRWVVLWVRDVVQKAKQASAQAERDDFLF